MKFAVYLHRETCLINRDFESLMKSVIDQFDCPILATSGGGYNFETTIGVAKAYTCILANYRKGGSITK